MGNSTPSAQNLFEGRGHVVCVDGNSLAHRAYHSHPGMLDAAGQPVGMLFGFASLLGGVLERLQPTHLVLGFDDHTGSWRRERWPHYKATRGERAFAFDDEMRRLVALWNQVGVTVVVPHHGEADDVLGRCAAAANEIMRCTLVTSDRDAISLVRPEVTMLKINNGLANAEILDPTSVEERYGVPPQRYRELAALRGDTSDNLPGVPGIGEKTAVKLLKATGSIDAAFTDRSATETAIGARLTKVLFEHAERVQMNLDVMRIDENPPLDLTVARLAIPEERSKELLNRAGLQRAANTLPALLRDGAHDRDR